MYIYNFSSNQYKTTSITHVKFFIMYVIYFVLRGHLHNLTYLLKVHLQQNNVITYLHSSGKKCRKTNLRHR